MTRRFLAVLAAVALTLCVGRVGAWAAGTGDAHACCHAQKDAAPKATVADCCPTAAAMTAPHFHHAAPVGVTAVTPRAAESRIQVSFVAPVPSLRGPGIHRAASPARAPPAA